jgi:hypothetical protein
MFTYIDDYKFGIENEDIVLPIIINYFKTDIKKSIAKYSIYDFYDSKNTYELKTFRCNIDKFENVYIDYKKLEKNTILLFKYNNALAYIKYNKDTFKNYKSEYFQRERDNSNDIKKLVVFIPISDLSIIYKYDIELDF